MDCSFCYTYLFRLYISKQSLKSCLFQQGLVELVQECWQELMFSFTDYFILYVGNTWYYLTQNFTWTREKQNYVSSVNDSTGFQLIIYFHLIAKWFWELSINIFAVKAEAWTCWNLLFWYFSKSKASPLIVPRYTYFQKPSRKLPGSGGLLMIWCSVKITCYLQLMLIPKKPSLSTALCRLQWFSDIVHTMNNMV